MPVARDRATPSTEIDLSRMAGAGYIALDAGIDQDISKLSIQGVCALYLEAR
jgi:hypothetical protein